MTGFSNNLHQVHAMSKEVLLINKDDAFSYIKTRNICSLSEKKNAYKKELYNIAL